jgi:dihydrolipoamide dehydrogenase
MSSYAYDLVVIGSGPGGYIGAIRASQLKMRVACVEKDPTLGGTCLNVGCIPSKALLESSERYEQTLHDLAIHGVEVEGVKLNLAQMLARKEKIVRQLTGGIDGLFRKNKVERVNGFGSILDAHTVRVTAADGSTRDFTTERILIATGSVVAPLPGVTPDGDRIVTSTEALSFPEVPKHLLIIGAGVIGVELGSVWRRLGAQVTILEYMPRILGALDGETAKAAQKTFEKQGLGFKLEVKVTSARVEGDQVIVTYEDRNDPSKTQEITGDRLMVCIGRVPFTEGLGLDAIGVQTERGRIPVNADYQTAAPSVYAIGDVIPGAMLAHKAEEEAVACVERMHGIPAHINYDAIPDVIYTWPEIASVGKGEEALNAAGIPFKKGSFPFAINGRAMALNSTEGTVKILAHAQTDAILGCQIIGPRAGDLIAELAVAMEFGASSEDIARSSHAHPTLAEVIKEAALAVDRRALNR